MFNPKTKKLSKAQIYAKYGIVYKDGKIVTPIGEMSELLKVGNSKTGAKVKTWSMNQTKEATFLSTNNSWIG